MWTDAKNTKRLISFHSRTNSTLSSDQLPRKKRGITTHMSEYYFYLLQIYENSFLLKKKKEYTKILLKTSF